MAHIPSAHLALYGNVSLLKSFCLVCQRQAIVSDGHLTCCGEPCEAEPESIKRESEGSHRRYKLSRSQRAALLDEQNHLCAYCERRFGSVLYRRNRAIVLKVTWDHVSPFAYSRNNHPSNYLAACQICNSLKSDFIFQTIEEVKLYVQTKQLEKGYRDTSDREDALPALQQFVQPPKKAREVLQPQMPPSESRIGFDQSSNSETSNDDPRSRRVLRAQSHHSPTAHQERHSQTSNHSEPQIVVQNGSDTSKTVSLACPACGEIIHHHCLNKPLTAYQKGRNLDSLMRRHRYIASDITRHSSISFRHVGALRSINTSARLWQIYETELKSALLALMQESGIDSHIVENELQRIFPSH